ncbi:MAG: hypothetical protein H0X37_20150 [Herpetosiphonaceae bacterium]|nr:hypothetical protein [Herpetosiphonaceae bacterium]
MQLKPRKPAAGLNAKSANSSAAHTSHTNITHRREIPVAAGQTVVVTPRLSPLYKTIIWFSFILNALLLILLLSGALMGLRVYRQYRAVVAAVADKLDSTGAVGQTIKGIATNAQQGPSGAAQAADQALALTQQKIGVLTGAVEGLQNATIKATIPIDQQVPVALQVGVDQDTTVVLTQPVTIRAPAHIDFPGGGGNLNTTVTLSLPTGFPLPIHLNMTIPVKDQKIQVKFDQPVTIPLKDTELAGPFAQLHELLKPLGDLFKPAH